jgi:D-alanyl-D-alanine carboxypeptidase/Lon protease-like protein
VRPGRHAAAVLVAAVATVAVVAGPAPQRGAAASPAAPARARSVAGRSAPAQDPPAAISDEVRVGLDGVVALSPAASCLTVSVDGKPVYRHQPTTPLAPASVEKLVTVATALDQLGPDLRFETRLVAATAPVGGVTQGDLTLVGGGDPVLVTEAYRAVRGIGADQAFTSLDAFADRIVATGLRRVTGRIVGDESRYDQARSVASWPERYLSQDQAGPLSALSVDDGFRLEVRAEGDGGKLVRTRSDAPAVDAARVLTELLRVRGVVVDGDAVAGVAPAGAVEVAAGPSAPMRDLAHHILLRSDNQGAELLVKEIGLRKGGGGSTAAGVGVIERRMQERGFATPGSHVVDGSGLDPANRATCDELVNVLEGTGGVDGELGPLLPVAGESGTLARRFRGTPAEGRVRAKTGSLNSVTTLAGFVSPVEGGRITFAYLANGAPITAELLRAQDLLAVVLASYLPPCGDVAAGPLAAVVAPYAAGVGTLAMFPLQSVLLPGAVLPLHVFEDRYKALVDRCLAADEDFGVVLISHGSEVGGGDQRTTVGTRAHIVQAEQAPDGRWGLIAVGTERFRVDRWLEDDPYPQAEVTDWPDPEPDTDVGPGLDAAASRLRRVLALRSELGDAVPPATFDLVDEGPSPASFRLASLAPLGDLDRQSLLGAPDVPARLAALDALLVEDEAVCRAELGGTSLGEG